MQPDLINLIKYSSVILSPGPDSLTDIDIVAQQSTMGERLVCRTQECVKKS